MIEATSSADKDENLMYAIALLRYRRPIEEVLKVQEPHRAYLRQLKADGVLLAAGPQDPRFGGMFLLRVPDEDWQAALDAVRDKDPYYTAGVAQYELIGWNVVVGKEDLDAVR
ncbi:MAG: YciI family protein [Acidobacteriota bacterium]